MVVAARPDVVGAIVARLRSFSELTALVGTSPPRISAVLQDAWPMPTHAVLIRAAGGRPGNRQVNLMQTRIDTFCYGSTAYEAMRVWQMLDAVLAPGQERSAGFRQTVNGVACVVGSVLPEGMPIGDLEPDTSWPRVVCPYIVTWLGVPG